MWKKSEKENHPDDSKPFGIDEEIFYKYGNNQGKKKFWRVLF